VRVGQHGRGKRGFGLDVGERREDGGLDDLVLSTGRIRRKPVEQSTPPLEQKSWLRPLQPERYQSSRRR
jgi:hypothetical protein